MFPKLTIKFLDAKMESDGDIFRAVISSASMDRDFEALLPDGCDASEFLKTGTVFWNHDYAQPIGKAFSVKRRGDELVSDFKFAQRPDDFDDEFFPAYVESLVRQGVVKGVSVGFAPVETRMPTPKDSQRYGPDLQRVTSKWKLYEWSIAPLQCNVDAVVEGVAKGKLSRALSLKHFPAASALKAPALPFKKTVVLDLGGIDIDTEVNAAVKKARGCIYID